VFVQLLAERQWRVRSVRAPKLWRRHKPRLRIDRDSQAPDDGWGRATVGWLRANGRPSRRPTGRLPRASRCRRGGDRHCCLSARTPTQILAGRRHPSVPCRRGVLLKRSCVADHIAATDRTHQRRAAERNELPCFSTTGTPRPGAAAIRRRRQDDRRGSKDCPPRLKRISFCCTGVEGGVAQDR
jgi:hypothetical protein